MGRGLRDGRRTGLHDTALRAESGGVARGGALASNGNHRPGCNAVSDSDLFKHSAADALPATGLVAAEFAGKVAVFRRLAGLF